MASFERAIPSYSAIHLSFICGMTEPDHLYCSMRLISPWSPNPPPFAASPDEISPQIQLLTPVPQGAATLHPNHPSSAEYADTITPVTPSSLVNPSKET